MGSLVFSEKLCRLCTKEREDVIGIFAEEASTESIVSLINRYLSIMVLKEDAFPKQICLSCLNWVKSWHSFWENCLENQVKLRDWLKKDLNQCQNDVESKISCENDSPDKEVLSSVVKRRRCNSQAAKLNSRKGSVERTRHKKENRAVKLVDSSSMELGSKEGESQSAVEKPLNSVIQEYIKNSTNYPCSLVLRNFSQDAWSIVSKCVSTAKGSRVKRFQPLERFLFKPPYTLGWKCMYCDKIFEGSEDYYELHVRGHKGVILFPCDVCGEHVVREKYIYHWVQHFMEFQCGECGKRFPKMFKLQQHQLTIHSTNRPYACKDCGQRFKQLGHLQNHQRLHLPVEEREKFRKHCNICGKAVLGSMSAHMMYHSEKRPWKCEVCNKFFKTKSCLNQHSKVHREKQYLCDYCGERFSARSHVQDHVRSRHERTFPHECEVCHRKYPCKKRLTAHSVKHKTTRDFLCEECGKGFKSKKDLRIHRSVHVDEKPYGCQLCGKQIRMYSNYLKHLKVHRGRGEFLPSWTSGNNSNSVSDSKPETFPVVATTDSDISNG